MIADWVHLRGEKNSATELLQQTRHALGKEWQPQGTTAEGDVKNKQHAESSPLRAFYEGWNGSEDPLVAFAPLKMHLRKLAVKLL